jgi:hypothetical protein
MNKDLIKQWGENSAYSAKGHFKTSDLKRIWIKTLITVNLLFAIFSTIDLIENLLILKIFGVISLIASVLILVYESQESKNSITNHMKLGDEYLIIHYELQELFHKDNFNETDLEQISKKIKRIKQKEKPIINGIAKKWAKNAIEKENEMIKWWK